MSFTGQSRPVFMVLMGMTSTKEPNADTFTALEPLPQIERCGATLETPQ